MFMYAGMKLKHFTALCIDKIMNSTSKIKWLWNITSIGIITPGNKLTCTLWWTLIIELFIYDFVACEHQMNRPVCASGSLISTFIILTATWVFQQCGMCDQQRFRSACAYAQSDQSRCWSFEYTMSVRLLTVHHLEFLSLKWGCTGSSESTLVKLQHCWKSHVAALLLSAKYFSPTCSMLLFVFYFICPSQPYFRHVWIGLPGLTK